jgi:hypothetical protein
MEEKIITPNYDTLLPLFVAREKYNPALRQPNTTDGYVWATDKHCLIKVPAHLLQSAYPSHDKAPDPRVVWGATEPFLYPTLILSTKLLDVLAQVDKESASSECTECEGRGYTECVCCGHEQTCEACEGEGYIPDYTLPEVYPDNDQFIGIGGAAFSPRRLGLLEQVVLAVGANTFEWISGEGHRQHVFQVGAATVYLMPEYEKEANIVLVQLYGRLRFSPPKILKSLFKIPSL